MSFRPEVIADSSGEWTPNGLRFATHDEARAWAVDLAMRWFAVRDIRVVEDHVEPVNYTFKDGKLEAVEEVKCD